MDCFYLQNLMYLQYLKLKLEESLAINLSNCFIVSSFDKILNMLQNHNDK